MTIAKKSIRNYNFSHVHDRIFLVHLIFATDDTKGLYIIRSIFLTYALIEWFVL